MPKPKFPLFHEAIKAGQRYIQTSVRARDAQYQFLSLVYLVHKEGQQHPEEFENLILSRLKRAPNRYEQARPYLKLLHCLLGREEHLPRNAVKQFSKLVAALEQIDKAFHGKKPRVEEITGFLADSGGVAGLYEIARIGITNGNNQSQLESHKVVDLKPNEIVLPVLGARVTKVGRRYRLRLTEREPGEYLVRLRIGRGGFVDAITDENISKDNAA
jgi:hypothetical protein